MKPTNVPQTCSHGEEGGKKLTTSKGNAEKHALTIAHFSGAIGCAGKLSGGNKRQREEADEVFAALTLDGTEASYLDNRGGVHIHCSMLLGLLAVLETCPVFKKSPATQSMRVPAFSTPDFPFAPRPLVFTSDGGSTTQHAIHGMVEATRSGGLFYCVNFSLTELVVRLDHIVPGSGSFFNVVLNLLYPRGSYLEVRTAANIPSTVNSKLLPM